MLRILYAHSQELEYHLRYVYSQNFRLRCCVEFFEDGFGVKAVTAPGGFAAGAACALLGLGAGDLGDFEGIKAGGRDVATDLRGRRRRNEIGGDVLEQ